MNGCELMGDWSSVENPPYFSLPFFESSRTEKIISVLPTELTGINVFFNDIGGAPPPYTEWRGVTVLFNTIGRHPPLTLRGFTLLLHAISAPPITELFKAILYLPHRVDRITYCLMPLVGSPSTVWPGIIVLFDAIVAPPPLSDRGSQYYLMQ